MLLPRSYELETEEQILVLAPVVAVVLLFKCTFSFFLLANGKLVLETPKSKPFLWHNAPIKRPPKSSTDNRKVLANGYFSLPPARAPIDISLPLNTLLWKHCYYPPVAHCTDECLPTLSPMFPSQSLSKCWINQPFSSRSHHEAAKLMITQESAGIFSPTLFLLVFSNKDVSSLWTLVFLS